MRTSSHGDCQAHHLYRAAALTFFKIEADEGIVGWGAPVVDGRALTVEAAVHALTDTLGGKDPVQIEDHSQVMYRGGFYRGGAIHRSALAM